VVVCSRVKLLIPRWYTEAEAYLEGVDCVELQGRGVEGLAYQNRRQSRTREN
jgi:hypothetical protein